MDNPTSPILRLPNELIAEIAAARINEAMQHRGFWSFSAPPELSLSHVCRRFRRALLGTSAFWTTFTLDIYQEGSVNLSRLYLERSATRDLRVSLGARGDGVASTLLHLIPHINRISWLSLEYMAPVSLSELLNPFKGVPVPRLKHVEFKGDSDWDGSPPDIFALDCPNISSLILSDCSHPLPPPHWLNNLTRLELREASHLVDNDDDADLFREIKTQAPFLTHLYFEVNSSYGDSGISSNSLTHMHLWIVDEGDEGLLNSLASTDTPALTHLTLQHTHGDQLSLLFNASKFHQTAELVFPALTSLVLITEGTHECKGDPNIVEQFEPIGSPPLQVLPVLSSLTLIRQCFTAKILSETFGPESAPWPLLRTVTLEPLENDVDEVYAALQDVVRWKRQCQEALPTLRLSQGLFGRGYWQEAGVDVELLDDRAVLDLLTLPAN